MTRIHLAALVAVAANLASVSAQQFFVDLNAPTDFTDNFNVYQNVNGGTVSLVNSPYSQAAGVGIGGTGGLAISQTAPAVVDSTAIYKNTTFNFANTGSALNISAMMKIFPTQENGNRLLQLGFSNEPTSGMNGNAGLSFMSLRFNPPATVGGLTFSPQWQTKTAAGGTVNTAGTPATVTFNNNEWYQMSVTFMNNGTAIEGSGFVQAFGADGTTPGAVTQLGSISLTSADIRADSTVYAAYRGFNRDGLANLDNLTAAAVPEPSTWALLGLSGLFLATRARRK